MWNAPSNSSQGGCTLLGYRLYLSLDSGSSYSDIYPGAGVPDASLNPVTREFTRTANMVAGSSYWFKVAIVTTKGTYFSDPKYIKAAGVPSKLSNKP